MTYRVRLLIILVLMALLTNGLLFAFMYTQFRDTYFEEIRSHTLSIASSIAAQYDGELQKKIKTRDDEASPAYHALRDRLRRARDANRRADVQIKFLYTIRQSASGQLEFVMDAEENPTELSHVGEKFETTGPRVRVGDTMVDAQFTTDKFGEFLSAYAPVKDAAGRVIGQLGVDVRSPQVKVKLHAVLMQGLLSLIISVGLAVIAALVLADRVSKPLIDLRNTVNSIERGDLHAKTALDQRKDEFGILAHAVNAMGQALLLKSSFARYVSKQVMDEILTTGEPPSHHVDRRRITVLFADVRGFTTLSEHMEPEDVVNFLNEYFERMVEVIFRNQGILDKFIGDGLMAVFNTGILPDAEHERHAVEAAIEMQDALRELRTRWEHEGRAAIRIGVGVHTGFAVVGNIGASDRLDYTSIGDTVNLASRLESATKDVQEDILISQDTYATARATFKFRETGSIKVKGREAPVMTYTIADPSPAVVD